MQIVSKCHRILNQVTMASMRILGEYNAVFIRNGDNALRVLSKVSHQSTPDQVTMQILSSNDGYFKENDDNILSVLLQDFIERFKSARCLFLYQAKT